MKKLCFIIITMAIFIGCSKTEEEEPPSTLTPQELILGEWDCTSWTQDGAELIDNIEYYKMLYYLESTGESFEFEYMTNTDGQKWQGTYEFQDNDTKLKTNFASQWFWNGSDWQASTPDDDRIWDIDKLTDETLELSYIVSTLGGTEYEFKMIMKK